ncbi:hypothetical protein Y695_04545 [Hydrogenophaga sp. T4]|nr:hypothetical protein Y695_04545 [Hydrogenophaga sp. T4]
MRCTGICQPFCGFTWAEMSMTGACACTPPKMVANEASAASRPVPMRTKPMGMAVPDGSNRYQRWPR